MTNNLFFQGNVKPYLQGQAALYVIDQSPDHICCYLGSKNTNIKVRDFRSKVVLAAKQVFSGDNEDQFSGKFNELANVKIQLEEDNIQIDLYDVTLKSSRNVPILWLGVINDGETIPFTPVHWEAYRVVDKSRTGFAMLIPE